MNAKRMIKGTTLGVIGFLLSPLSWWNDLFVNVPLALVFAWFVSVAYPPAFAGAFIVGYWLTNVVGLILMNKGIQALVSKESSPNDRRSLVKDLAVSIIYTGVIVLLMKLKVVEPLPNYFVGE